MIDDSAPEREIEVTRQIDGPARLVFDAYTEVRHLSQWWGPDGFSTATDRFEFHPGGVWEFTMHGPDGTDFPNWIQWLEISPPERIVFRHGSRPDDPDAFTSIVTIVDRGDRCELSMRAIFNTKAQRDEVVERYRAIEGAEQTVRRLASYIEQEGPE